MPGVSKEQIAAAKRMTAIEFLRRFRPNELVRSGSRGEFQLREHDSFKINGESSIWHWKSRDIGGKSALDYLIKVEGMKFVDAVLALCDECPGYIPPPPRQKKRPEFILPPAAMNNRRVFAYLLKRGISRGVIEACIRAGILYESADYHNAVFVGRDETGENPSRQRCRAAISGFASCCRRREKPTGWPCTKPPLNPWPI